MAMTSALRALAPAAALLVLPSACGSPSLRPAGRAGEASSALLAAGQPLAWENAEHLAVWSHEGEFSLWPSGTAWLEHPRESPVPLCVSTRVTGDQVECAVPYRDCVLGLTLRSGEGRETLQITSEPHGADCPARTWTPLTRAPFGELVARGYVAMRGDLAERDMGPRASEFVAYLGSAFSARLAADRSDLSLVEASLLFDGWLSTALQSCRGEPRNLHLPCVDRAFSAHLTSRTPAHVRGESEVPELPQSASLSGTWLTSPETGGFELRVREESGGLTVEFGTSLTLRSTTCTGPWTGGSAVLVCTSEAPATRGGDAEEMSDENSEETSDEMSDETDGARPPEPPQPPQPQRRIAVDHVADAREVLVVRTLEGDWHEANGEDGVWATCDGGPCGGQPLLWGEAGMRRFRRVDPLHVAVLERERTPWVLLGFTEGTLAPDLVESFVRRELTTRDLDPLLMPLVSARQALFAVEYALIEQCVQSERERPTVAAALEQVRSSEAEHAEAEHAEAGHAAAEALLRRELAPCVERTLATPGFFDRVLATPIHLGWHK